MSRDTLPSTAAHVSGPQRPQGHLSHPRYCWGGLRDYPEGTRPPKVGTDGGGDRAKDMGTSSSLSRRAPSYWGRVEMLNSS